MFPTSTFKDKGSNNIRKTCGATTIYYVHIQQLYDKIINNYIMFNLTAKR